MDEQIIEEQSVDEPNKLVQFDPIAWQAEEFEAPRRNWIWYVIVGIAGVALLVYFIYTRQWLLAAVVLLIGVVLFLSGRLRPRTMQYQISNAGVSINEKVFPFEELKNFWFHRREGKTYLNLISTHRLMPVITIKVPEGEEARIREVLSRLIPESARQDEDWIDKINRFLKV